MDDGAPRRAQSRREGGCGVGQPDGASLPAPARRRGGPVDRRGLAARPHGPRPYPPGGGEQNRRAGRSRRGRGRRNHGGRRPGPGGLLPLPAVLRSRPGRAALARRCLAPPLQRGASGCCRLGFLCLGGAGSPQPAARSRRAPPRAGGPGHPARCAAQRRLGPRGRAGLAPDPRHQRRRALRPGARTVCGRAHHPGVRLPAAGGPRGGGTPGGPGLRRQLSAHAHRPDAERGSMPGRSSST